MDAAVTGTTAPAVGRERSVVDRMLRSVPVRWRIIAVAALNAIVVALLAPVVWMGERTVTAARGELEQAQRLDELLTGVESDTERLQGLIHRYFNQPTPDVLAEIERRRAGLLAGLDEQALGDPSLSIEITQLSRITQRFLAGFDALREVRADIARVYETEVLGPAREMAGLYAIIDTAAGGQRSLVWPSLGKSREAYSAAVVAANAFYLSTASDAAENARRQLDAIERTVPVMMDLAEGDLQKSALLALKERAAAFRTGLDRLAQSFATQTRLLKDAIDGNQSEMSWVIERIVWRVRDRQKAAQARFDRALDEVYTRFLLVGLAFLATTVLIGIGVSRSISRPLAEIRTAMLAIVDGKYDRRVEEIDAPDEIGDMARAVEVFRGNALAKHRAEEELRASKERAEAALSELKDTQQSLIEAEKLAALGALVAGVAHEVNNPVGISLTVASSMARRCEAFSAELAEGSLRRSRLVEFVEGAREAAYLLVTNLQRAGELIQSFKQVAVDRSHAERRSFDLKESTEQIVASLRPGLKKRHLALAVDVQPGITMDSYPGPYGQVLTNLFINAVTHAFADNDSGTVRLLARRSGPNHVEILFSDDGRGMSDDVRRRAFDPFFTTKRGRGGTGLGLHIVYNLVTRRLGGRITLTSEPGRGTSFRLVLPLVAPFEEAPAEPERATA